MGRWWARGGGCGFSRGVGWLGLACAGCRWGWRRWGGRGCGGVRGWGRWGGGGGGGGGKGGGGCGGEDRKFRGEVPCDAGWIRTSRSLAIARNDTGVWAWEARRKR